VKEERYREKEVGIGDESEILYYFNTMSVFIQREMNKISTTRVNRNN
jgi:hypothetical protein